MKDKKAITVKTLSKSNVWDLQENDIFRLLETVEKDAELKENMRHYTDIIKTAFDMEEIKVDKPEIIKKYEDRGFKVAQIGKPEDGRPKLAIKKRPILRVTDLTTDPAHIWYSFRHACSESSRQYVISSEIRLQHLVGPHV